MPVVETRLTANNAQFLAQMDQANAKMGQLERSVLGVNSTLQQGFRTAGVIGLAVGFDQLYDALGRTITRYNTLMGLDKGGLFFNARNDVAALTKGLGDMAVTSTATAQAIRFLSAEAQLNLTQMQQIGGFARGQVLLGESPSIEHALHAVESYITGGQSRMLHMAGVGVDTRFAYRDYAAQMGVTQASLTGQQRMYAREAELLRNPGFINTVDFAGNAQSTAFQGIGSFLQNTKDSYVRSLAGSIEELARSFRSLNTEMDPNKLGRGLAIATPLLTGGVGMLGTFANMGGRNVQLQQLLAQNMLGSGQAFTGMNLSQEAASVANLRLQAQQNSYAYMRAGIDERMTGMPAMSRADMLYMLSDQPAAQRLISPTGAVLGFEQTALGAGAQLGANRAGQQALAATRQYEESLTRVRSAQSAVAVSSNLMWAAIGVQAGIAVISSLWIAHANALQAARKAQDDFNAAQKESVSSAHQLQQIRKGGGGNELLAQTAAQLGLKPDSIAQLAGAGNLSEAQFAAKVNQLLLQQQQSTNLPAEIGGVRANAWSTILGGLANMSPGMGISWTGQSQIGAGISNLFAAPQIAAGSQQQQLQDAIKNFPKLYQDFLKAQQQMQTVEASQAYEDLQTKLAGQQDFYTRYGQVAAGMGYTPKVPYATIAQQQADKAILGFDITQLQGAELKDADRLQRQAMQRQITEEQQKEVDTIREHVEKMRAQNAASEKIAQAQDAMLGPYTKLLDQTNEEAARHASNNRIIAEVTGLMEQGKDAMIDEMGLRDDYNRALREETMARIDMSQALRRGIEEFRSSIPALMQSAAANLQTQISGQAALEQGMAGKNQFLSQVIGLDAQGKALGPMIGELTLNRQILAGMERIQNLRKSGVDQSQIVGTVANEMGLSDEMAALLSNFNNMAPDAQMSLYRTQRSTIAEQTRGLQSGIYSFLGATAGFRGSLQDLPEEQRKNVIAMQQSPYTLELQQQLGMVSAYGMQQGWLNPDQMKRLGTYFGGTIPPGADVQKYIAEQAGAIGVETSKEAELIGAFGTLTAAVNANTQALGGKTPDDGFPEWAKNNPGTIAGTPQDLLMGPPPIGGSTASGGGQYYPLGSRVSPTGHIGDARYRNGAWHHAHQGVDLPAPEGTPVYAYESGQVQTSGWGDNYSGNLIRVAQDKANYQRYLHLSKMAVNKGDTVSAGQLIGYTGDTGSKGSFHLHFEDWINGKINQGIEQQLGNAPLVGKAGTQPALSIPQAAQAAVPAPQVNLPLPLPVMVTNIGVVAEAAAAAAAGVAGAAARAGAGGPGSLGPAGSPALASGWGDSVVASGLLPGSNDYFAGLRNEFGVVPSAGTFPSYPQGDYNFGGATPPPDLYAGPQGPSPEQAGEWSQFG